MKSLLACTGLLIAAATLSAQTPAPKPPPVSPHITENATIAGKSITINYNSPKVKGRSGHIFTKDGLISHDPHYPVWRAGANAATTLQTDANLDLGGVAVAPGTYTLFVDISDPDQWVLIVSKKTGEWGLAYDASQDLGKAKMTMTKPAATIEDLKYGIMGTGGSGATLSLGWEDHIATVPITVQ